MKFFFSGIDIFNLSYSKIKTKFVISSKVNNFYLADPISKASPTMTKCSKQLLLKSPFLDLSFGLFVSLKKRMLYI